jgi:hypothetical protein
VRGDRAARAKNLERDCRKARRDSKQEEHRRRQRLFANP